MKSSIDPVFLEKSSTVLKLLGHPIRIKIIEYLEQGEHSVGEIQNEINQIQAITSQHLRLMLRKGIVVNRREGTNLYYSIANDFIKGILKCIRNCSIDNPSLQNNKKINTSEI